MNYAISLLLFLSLLISNGGPEPLHENLNAEDLHNWVTATELLHHKKIWISYGSHEPGDEVVVDWPQPEDGIYYYKLIRIDEEPETIYEETRELEETDNDTIADWTVTLPDELPAKYRFGVALRQNSKTKFYVRDILVDDILVEMWLDKEVYGKSATPVMKIRNNDVNRITIEEGYEFEAFRDGEWKNVPFNIVVIEYPFVLLPGKTFSQKLSQRPAFRRGKYRVLRTVFIGRARGFIYSEVLTAEFIVKPKLWPMIIGALVVIMTLVIVRNQLLRYLEFQSR